MIRLRGRRSATFRPTPDAMRAPSRVAPFAFLFGLATVGIAAPAGAQIASRAAPVAPDHLFALAPRSACVHLSMQMGSNAQMAMRSGAQNHNSSRSNRRSTLRSAAGTSTTGDGATGGGATLRAQNHNSSRSNRVEPIARPDIVTGDGDGNGFPDLWSGARLRVAGSRARATGSADIRLELRSPDGRTVSDLVDATTFRVTRAADGARGNPLHEESGTVAENPLFERGAAGPDAPLREWTYTLVPVAGDPDSDEDGYGDALAGATVRISEAGGFFHVDLELPPTPGRSGSQPLEAASFTIAAGRGG
jgi:hypothetical protein